MATLETPAAPSTNGNPTSPVPLDTIPISPAGENGTGDSEGKDPSGSAAHNSDQPITVFHDKDNFNVKHPLMNEWTLWFTKPPSGKVRCYLESLSWLDANSSPEPRLE